MMPAHYGRGESRWLVTRLGSLGQTAQDPLLGVLGDLRSKLDPGERITFRQLVTPLAVQPPRWDDSNTTNLNLDGTQALVCFPVDGVEGLFLEILWPGYDRGQDESSW